MKCYMLPLELMHLCQTLVIELHYVDHTQDHSHIVWLSKHHGSIDLIFTLFLLDDYWDNFDGDGDY